MMSFKLALGNVKKSFRDYFIYFLTLLFGVCIFYIFNSVESQQSMMMISASQHEALKSLSRIMGYVSIFISVILGFLILYANGFLIKRRKKELGIYETLGMEKGQISKVLVIETVLVGLFSLAVGLLLGVLLSQGFAVVTASLFQVKLKGFIFIFSMQSMLKTVFYFGLIFLLTMVFNAFVVGRQKLIDLLYADRKNETFKTPHLLLSVVVFILSLICLATAYQLIIENGILLFNKEFYVSIALGAMGTFLFFISLSGFFLKLIQQNKKIYLKNLNMFVLRQLNSKIHTNYISMTMVCLMLFVSICTLSSGMGMSKALTNESNDVAPYDASCSVYVYEQDNNQDNEIEKYIDVKMKETYENAGVDFTTFAREMVEANYYEGDAEFMKVEFLGTEIIPDLMKLSDYNKILELSGKEQISLAEDEFVINCNYNEVREQYEKLSENIVSLEGTKLHYKEASPHTLINASTDLGTVIVQDHLIQNREVIRNTLLIQYIAPTQKYEDLWNAAKVTADFGENGTYAMGIASNTKQYVFENNKSLSATVAYIAVYIGIVFLITSAAVLAIAQLSEASDNIKRYTLLRKLGTEQRMIHKAILLQISVYFLVPLLLAIVHSIVGIYVASNVVEQFGSANTLQDGLLAACIITIIYGGYFVATYLGSKSIINRR